MLVAAGVNDHMFSTEKICNTCKHSVEERSAFLQLNDGAITINEQHKQVDAKLPEVQQRIVGS